GGELYYSRQIDITLPQLQTDDDERLSRLFDRLALEVQRSLDNFERQFPKIGLNRLMLAPCAARAGMRDFLLSYMGVKVDTFDLADVLDMGNLNGFDTLDAQAQVLGVLGAAMREGGA
ncbi:MAG TPA: agglutinin biogenesis protein MshI, partial [Methylophilaceae bacterium]|nr:agglutinin biogenesis protein MshI [Methylophilaceae bacterium]